jgi:hypothetical protein
MQHTHTYTHTHTSLRNGTHHVVYTTTLPNGLPNAVHSNNNVLYNKQFQIIRFVRMKLVIASLLAWTVGWIGKVGGTADRLWTKIQSLLG